MAQHVRTAREQGVTVICHSVGMNRDVDEYMAHAREESVSWARDLFEDDNVLLIDTETTGLKRPYYAVEIALTDITGNVVFQSLMNPYPALIEETATKVHGYRQEDLVDAPQFGNIEEELRSIIAGKRLVGWNVRYDLDCLGYEAVRYLRSDLRHWAAVYARGEDAQARYAQFIGEWNYTVDPPVPGRPRLSGPHGAVGDCLTMIDRLGAMVKER